jgi:predicted lipid-binding transport protein (Tim44 family)
MSGDGRRPTTSGPPIEGIDGNWKCSCGNINYGVRTKCNRCTNPRPDVARGMMAGAMGVGGGLMGGLAVGGGMGGAGLVGGGLGGMNPALASKAIEFVLPLRVGTRPLGRGHLLSQPDAIQF